MKRIEDLVVYVDVDDTLVRSVGTTRIPVPAAVDHVRRLAEQGATLYCWSAGGGAARTSRNGLVFVCEADPGSPIARATWESPPGVLLGRRVTSASAGASGDTTAGLTR